MVGADMVGRRMVGRMVGRRMVGRHMVGRRMVGRRMVGRRMVGRRMVGRRMVGRHMVGRRMVGRRMVGRHIVGRHIVGGEWLVGAGRIELPTSWSQTRRPAAGPRPETTNRVRSDGRRVRNEWTDGKGMVPPERIELSSLAPEASTLSAELQGHCKLGYHAPYDASRRGIEPGEFKPATPPPAKRPTGHAAGGPDHI